MKKPASYLLAICWGALILSGCSIFHRHPKAAGIGAGIAEHHAEISVLTATSIPFPFVLLRGPIWDLQSHSVALLGWARNQLTILRFSGDALDHFTVTRFPSAAHGETDAPRLLDVAIGPDGSSMATLEFVPQDQMLHLRAIDIGLDAAAHEVATLDATPAGARLVWLDDFELGVGIYPVRTNAALLSADDDSDIADRISSGSQLYAVNLNNLSQSGERLRTLCDDRVDFTAMVHVPRQRRIIVGARSGRWSYLVDLDKRQCEQLAMPSVATVQVLEFNPEATALLYSAPLGAVYGVFECDLKTRNARLIAAPAVAASYARGFIAVISSRQFNGAYRPQTIVPIDVGLFSRAGTEAVFSPLGTWSTLALLPQSSASYSSAADALAVELAVPRKRGFVPYLMYFSLERGAGGRMLAGEPDSSLAFAWEPKGRRLAVFDGTLKQPRFEVLIAPQP